MPLARRMSTRAQDVVGRQRDVLAAGAVVELEVLVDLRLLLRDRRLVERELHPVVAARDDLAHQRGVVGGDVVADELGHVREAHDLVVERHPLVHPAELDVADAVVDRLEEPLRVALAAASPSGPRRRSRAGRGRRSRLRSTSVCRVSPYVAIAAMRTVPCSSDSSCGSPGSWRPTERACSMHLSTSGTSSARSTTPSPCWRWWSSERAVRRHAAGEARTGRCRSAARRTWSPGSRSRGRGRPRGPCRARAGRRSRSGWRCRPRTPTASIAGDRERVAGWRRTPRARPAA